KDTAWDRFDMKGQCLSDARLVLERWSEMIAINDSSSNWPQFEGRLMVKTDVVKRIEGIKDDAGLASVFGLSNGRFVERHWRGIASRRLAATELAIRLYEVEQGKLPENLAALVPENLPAVPLDPMARGKTFGYVADPRRPVVYSVGQNETDEGGSDKP